MVTIIPDTQKARKGEDLKEAAMSQDRATALQPQKQKKTQK